MPLLEAKGIKKDKAFVTEFCSLVKEKAHFVTEFWGFGSFLFITPDAYDQDVLTKRLNEQTRNFVVELTSALTAQADFSPAATEATFKATAEKLGIGAGQVMQLFRVVVTGVGGGPNMFEIMELIGKEESIKRMNLFLERNK
jgi:glutamyl-tRNA synthetase